MNQFVRNILHKARSWNGYICLKFSVATLRFAPVQKASLKKYTSLPPPVNLLQNPKTYKRKRPFLILTGGVLSFLSKSNEEETPEDKLIMNIKRSILCMQREEFGKAEKMLHLALRMAQDLNNKDGITYIYDLMANLALQVEQFAKAKKLFVTVMQRLLQDGYQEDDNKVLKCDYKTE